MNVPKMLGAVKQALGSLLCGDAEPRTIHAETGRQVIIHTISKE